MYDIKPRTLLNPQISEDDLNRLKQLYTLKEQEDVIAFIKVYPFVINFLFEAEDKIHSYFPESELFLRMFNNPEAMDDTYLLIQIRTTFSPKETLQRFNQLEDEWWLDTLVSTKGKLSINVKYS